MVMVAKHGEHAVRRRELCQRLAEVVQIARSEGNEIPAEQNEIGPHGLQG
jgi:hypothetical protein